MGQADGRPMAESVQLWTGGALLTPAYYFQVPMWLLVTHLTLHVMHQQWRDRLLDWTHPVAWVPVLLHLLSSHHCHSSAASLVLQQPSMHAPRAPTT